MVKLFQKAWRVTKTPQLLEAFKDAAGMEPADLVKKLRGMGPSQAADWLTSHQAVAGVLDRITATGRKQLISKHSDEIDHVGHG